MSNARLLPLTLLLLASGCQSPVVALKSAEAGCMATYDGKNEDACLLGARAAQDHLIAAAPHSRGVGASLTLMARVRLMVTVQCGNNFSDPEQAEACKVGGMKFAEAMNSE